MVFEIPPTWLSASKTIGVISERRSNSRAAVSPAGPAPATTAIFLRPWAIIRTASRVHAPAIIEIPVLPRSRLSMTDRVEPDIFSGDYEIELRIAAQADETVPSEGPGRGTRCVAAAVYFMHAGQEPPIGIL